MSFDSSPFQEIETSFEAQIRNDPVDYALPESAVDKMKRNGVAAQEIDKIIGRIDVRRSVSKDGMLTAEASERAARLARVINLAQRVFGSEEKAFLWLRAPNGQTGGGTPISYVSSEAGARIVEDVLIRIDHGVAA